MPPKKNTGDVSTLSETEMRFIKALFDNMTQKPDTDWEKVAETLSLKDGKCAKERWRQMSIRHGWRGDASAPAGSTPRKTTAAAGDKVAKKPRTPRKKKETAPAAVYAADFGAWEAAGKPSAVKQEDDTKDVNLAQPHTPPEQTLPQTTFIQEKLPEQELAEKTLPEQALPEQTLNEKPLHEQTTPEQTYSKEMLQHIAQQALQAI